MFETNEKRLDVNQVLAFKSFTYSEKETKYKRYMSFDI